MELVRDATEAQPADFVRVVVAFLLKVMAAATRERDLDYLVRDACATPNV